MRRKGQECRCVFKKRLETVLNLCQAKPENIELAKTIRSGYSEITLEDVQNAAKEIFGKKPYEITIMPDAEAK